jgi:hypothetical protein
MSPGSIRRQPVVRAGLSIAEFCRLYGVAPRTFYNWRKRGVAPAVTQPAGPGGKVIITDEAQQAWRRAHTGLAAVIEIAG